MIAALVLVLSPSGFAARIKQASRPEAAQRQTNNAEKMLRRTPSRDLSQLEEMWSLVNVSVAPNDAHSLVQEAEDVRTDSTGCVGHEWEKTNSTFFAKGSYGQIWNVHQARGYDKGKYVMKVASSQDKVEALLSEIAIMARLQCRGIMPVIDQAPCFHYRPAPGAFVMKKMKTDLEHWFSKWGAFGSPTSAGQIKMRKCRAGILASLRDALSCLHSSHYVHGDFKEDQVLYGYEDADGCPQDIQISDFGLTMPANGPNYKFDAQWYRQSGHLPGSLFKYAPDALGLAAASYSTYTVSPLIDWCSLLLMMSRLEDQSDFSWFRTIKLPSGIRSFRCGMMESARTKNIDYSEFTQVQKVVWVDQGGPTISR